MLASRRLALAGIALAALALTVSMRESSIRDWADGPVRYVMSEREIRDWKGLKTDDQRAVFVERFWARRDPTPTTLANEYRELFWQRVKEANERFLDSSRPGWRTDRGKIHILYGPPNEIQEDPNAQTEDLPGASRGLIRWIYQGRPAPDKTVDPVVVVPFLRDVSGEYRLSHDPRLASVFFDWEALKDKDSAFWNNWLNAHVSSGKNELGVMLDQGTLQAIPSQEEFLISRVETIETYETHPMDVSVSRFRSPEGDGTTLAIVTISIPALDYPTPPALIARFAPRDATRAPKVLGEGSFRIEGEGPDRVAQTRIRLEPGIWSLAVLAADPEGRSNGLHHSVVEAEPSGEALRTSDVLLARTIEPLPYKSLTSYDEPYLIGSFRVVPRAGRVIRRGEDVSIFYEIYGGKLPYRVTYRLEGKEDDGRFTPLGRPIVRDPAEAVQGWSLPTSPRWPAGEYRLRVAVEDSAGAHVDSTTAFSLAAEGSAP